MAGTRFDRGFRFPLQKYSDEKAIYSNFRYLQEYLNYIRKKDKSSASVIVATKGSPQETQADFVCNGANDDIQLQQAFDTLPANGGEVVLFEGEYKIEGDMVVNPGSENFDLTVTGHGAVINVASADAQNFAFNNGGMLILQGLTFTSDSMTSEGIYLGIDFGQAWVDHCHFHDLGCGRLIHRNSPFNTYETFITNNQFTNIDLNEAGLTGQAEILAHDSSGGTARLIAMGNIFRNLDDNSGLASRIWIVDEGFSVIIMGNSYTDIGTVSRNSPEEVHYSLDGVHFAGTHNLALDDLTDVVLGSLVDNDLLAYDSTSGNWINQDLAEVGHDTHDHSTALGTAALGDLGDVTETTPADNEVLAYDTGTSEWINQTAAEAGLALASDLAEIDVVSTSFLLGGM